MSKSHCPRPLDGGVSTLAGGGRAARISGYGWLMFREGPHMLVHSAGALVERAALAYGAQDRRGVRRPAISYASRIARIRQTGRALLSLAWEGRPGRGADDRPPGAARRLLRRRVGRAGRRPAERQGIRLGPRVHHRRLRRPGVVHDASKADRVAGARAETDVEHVFSVDADAVLDGGGYLPHLVGVQPDGPGRPEVTPDDRYGIF